MAGKGIVSMSRVRFTKICEADGKLYFFALGMNGLFNLNPDTGEARLLSSVPDEYPFAEALYRDMQYFEGKLYGIPFSASGIAIYDLAEEKMKVVKTEALPEASEKFISSFVYKRKIYMIPFMDNSIWTFDTDTGGTECISNLTGYQDAILKKAVILHDTAYFVCFNYNFVFSYNLLDGERKYYFPKKSREGFRDLFYDGNWLWLLPVVGGSLTAMEIGTGIFKTFEIIKDAHTPCFSMMIKDKNCLLLLPSAAGQFASFDIDSGNVELIKLKQEYIKESGLNFSYGFSFGGRNFGLSNKRRSLVILDENQEENPIYFCNAEALKISPEDIKGHLIKEQPFFTLERYLSLIPYSERKALESLEEESIGFRIHRIID